MESWVLQIFLLQVSSGMQVLEAAFNFNISLSTRCPYAVSSSNSLPSKPPSFSFPVGRHPSSLQQSQGPGILETDQRSVFSSGPFHHRCPHCMVQKTGFRKAPYNQLIPKPLGLAHKAFHGHWRGSGIRRPHVYLQPNQMATFPLMKPALHNLRHLPDQWHFALLCS